MSARLFFISLLCAGALSGVMIAAGGVWPCPAGYGQVRFFEPPLNLFPGRIVKPGEEVPHGWKP